MPELWDTLQDSNAISNLLDPYAGFDIIPGTPIAEKPQISEVPGASWRDGATGNLLEYITQGQQKAPSDVKYNVYEDIPLRHFDESYLPYYIDSMSKAQTEAISMKVDREARDNEIRKEYPVSSFFGGAIFDPLFFAVPGGSAGLTLKQAYRTGLKAGLSGAKGSAIGFAKEVSKRALVIGASASAQEAATQALVQQTHITKSIADSFFDISMSALLGTGLGAVGATAVGISAIRGVRNAHSHAVNTSAGIPDVPTIVGQSKMKPGTAIRPDGPMGPNWAISPDGPMRPINPQGPNGPIKPVPASEIDAVEREIGGQNDSVGAAKTTLTVEDIAIERVVPERVINTTPITRAVMESNNRVANIPVWIQNATKFSVSNQLQVSPFATSPFVSRLLFSNPLVSIANVDENIASPRALDDRIFSAQQALWNPARVKIQEIFAKQLGVDGKFLSGARARLANALADGSALNRDEFALSVFDVLNTNVKSRHSAVNETARILRNEVMLPLKKQLVALKLLHPKFLESQYDAYFHRMFNKGSVGTNPNEFEALLFEFYKDARNFYRDNAVIIDSLRMQPDKTRAELDAVRLRTDLEPAKKNELIEKLTNRMMLEYKELYEYIPPEYAPADGHIPSVKTDDELRVSANQTLMRVLGTDIESAMSIFGPGSGGSNPLQARALGMPNDYSAEIVDSDGMLRTVIASDFIEKDFDRVFSKVVRQLTPVIENTKLANELGFENVPELKRFLLESLEADYNFLKKELQGPEAAKLTKQYKSDQKRINLSFDVMSNVAGTDMNVYGPGYAKFLRHLAEYNRVRMLGSAALSSIPDLMVGPFRQGFNSLVADWISPFAQSIVTLQKNKAVAINNQDAKNLGFALNVEMGKIAKALQNNDELLIKKSWWGSISEPIVNMLGNVTGVNQIQDLIQNKNFTGSVSRTMRTIARQIEKKTLSERNRRRLRSIGIPDEDVPIIYKMWREIVGQKGGKDGTVYYSDMGKWKINTPERMRAYENFREATVRDVRQSQTVATAGDKWRHSQDTTVRSVLQFKDFLFAANNKILLSGIQKLGMKEYDVLFSTMLMLAMGSFAYILTSLFRDPTLEKTDLSINRLFHEGLDRSALLALYGEFKNIGTKSGILPEWLGPEVSRFMSRGVVSSFVGPTLGTIEDTANFMKNIKQHMSGEKEITQKDLNQILRFLPYQNLFYLRYIFQQGAESLGESIGAEQ